MPAATTTSDPLPLDITRPTLDESTPTVVVPVAGTASVYRWTAVMRSAGTSRVLKFVEPTSSEAVSVTVSSKVSIGG
ncbi:MAG TPA: hypothetical protein PJ994_02720 [Tepidiformaceae bacterium]|nr:hypothetical protein [Tepidiformaceae bacterium]